VLYLYIITNNTGADNPYRERVERAAPF